MVSHMLLKTPQEWIHLLDTSAMSLHQPTKSLKGNCNIFSKLYPCTKISIVSKEQKDHSTENIQCKNKAHNLGVLCITELLKDGIRTLVCRQAANTILHTSTL